MRKLTAQQLKQWKTSNRSMTLINVLDSEDFEKGHIPGSINIPVTNERFVDEVKRTVDDKEATIVVYCASLDCDASTKAAHRLDKAGFANVYEFEGGMKEWKAAGHEVTEPATVNA
jgi:rhodanese-related sulfurtransferase